MTFREKLKAIGIPSRRVVRMVMAAGACFVLLSLVVAGVSGIFEAAAPKPAASDVETADAADAQLHYFQTQVPEGYFRRTLDITVTVDDLDAAARAVEQLNGYNASATLYYGDSSGHITRRVDTDAYEAVKEALHGLGTVNAESESITKMASAIADTQARLNAKTLEAQRLSDLLAKSLTMDVLAAVERRLGYVVNERDALRGTLNGLLDETAHPYVYITLYETPPPPTIIPDKTFAARVRDRFVVSFNTNVTALENFVVFMSGAFVPLLVVVGVIGLGAVLMNRRKRVEHDD